jgi:modification methylase ecoRI
MVNKRKNGDLHVAKIAKNDEFYTQISDIEKEMKYYKHHFKDKVIYCNCDDPEWSEFWLYFKLNFGELGLKKLISTHYTGFTGEKAYKLEMTKYGQEPVRTDLIENGDFASKECIEVLKEADIVVTNPPFSLFRDYIKLLMDYDKKFLIIGNMNAVTYKDVFPLFQNNKIWYGASISSGDRKFNVPNSYPLTAANCGIDENGKPYVRVKGVRWFTNLSFKKLNNKTMLWRRYYDDNGNHTADALERYQKYDNYEAINVDKVADIPIDYYGIMGVPITFLDKYNPSDTDVPEFNGVSLEGDLAAYFDVLGLTHGRT